MWRTSFFEGKNWGVAGKKVQYRASYLERIEVRACMKRGVYEVTLVGALANISAPGTHENTRNKNATGDTFLMVAGVGFEPTTFRL